LDVVHRHKKKAKGLHLKIVPERKPGFFVKVKDVENFNRKKPGVFYGLKFDALVKSLDLKAL